MGLPRAYSRGPVTAGGGGGGGVTDHGALTGLADDDHTQYSLVAGTRAFTGAQRFIAGNAAGPGVAPGSATVGLFSGGSGATEYLGLTANGTEFMRSTSALATLVVPMLLPAGSAAAPSLAVGDASNGLYFLGSAGATEAIGFTTNGTVRGNWSATGLRVGDATAADLTLDVIGRASIRNSPTGGIALLIGGDSLLTSRTDATDKIARMAVPHYTIAEEPVGVFMNVNNVASNWFYWGGGSAQFNTATMHRFYAATTTTTVTGTEMMRLTAAGLRIQDGMSADASYLLQVVGSLGILACSGSLNTVSMGDSGPIANSRLFINGSGASSTGALQIYTDAGAHLRFGGDNSSQHVSFFMNSTGLLTVSNTGSTPQFKIDGPAASALAVLNLTQGDDDEPFIALSGTSAANATKSLSTFTVPGAVYGYARVEVVGVGDKWVQLLEAPTA